MRKLKTLFIISTLIFNASVFAFDYKAPKNFIKKSAKAEIKTVLSDYSKAVDKKDFERVRSFYDVDYRSSDGFTLDEIISMLDKTYKAYGNIKYKTKINNITAYDNWALVQLSDKSFAKVYPEGAEKTNEKAGILSGKSVYNLYLKKGKNSDWKIYRDDILLEETSLKYGIANKINIDLVTPMFVKSGSEYELSLKIDKPEDILALGSLSREEITYPNKDYPEKFRKISPDGDLERVVRANDKNLDEYAIASLGFTRVLMNEEQTKARIEVLGMAYILKRINMDRLKTVEASENIKKETVKGTVKDTKKEVKKELKK